ncbi:MAG: glycosyl hydrolase-related protein [Clostridiales bacterium]|nr:glycosyl hydrolase-related protein [Clostridiales bacterium]
MLLMKERVNKLITDLCQLIYSDRRQVQEFRVKRETEILPVPVRMQREAEYLAGNTSDWQILRTGEIWGGHRGYFYFDTTVVIPGEWAGKCVVFTLRTGREGEWDALNPQFLAYVNGQIKQGLDINHREIVLTECAEGGESFRILLSAFTGDKNFSLYLDSEIKVRDKAIEAYYYDLQVPYQVARRLPEDSRERIAIVQALNESLNLLDLRRAYSKEFYESLDRAQEYLTREFYEKQCGCDAPVIDCVGHTHIDVAWLWTLATTEDKAVRSFSTVLELMKRYPEYKFMSSQPQLYKYVKKNAPAVYEEIKARVAEGRWEPEGGMFVEADCNLASGESLVRQFLFGTRFFEQEFGKKNEVLWLPDVFGYSAALPQIMKRCGIRYFMTTKISWNEFNKMPYDTFLWEGIDGSEILTHFIPSRDYNAKAVEDGTETAHFTTYNAMLNPSMAMGSWQRYSQKYLNEEVLMSYGYGDGGGGPTSEMLENMQRMEKGIPGCPKTVPAHSAEFFHRLEKQVSGNKYLPKWVGELYLEYHRGTYTSMARNKRYNRKAEFACENLEFYRILANQMAGLPYPRSEINELWEVILRNQFHDILPGSSIHEVYEDSKKEYDSLFAACNALTEQALRTIADAAGGSGQMVVLNPNSTMTAAPLVISTEEWGKLCAIENTATAPKPENCVLCDGENRFELQATEDGVLAVVSGIPAKGYQKVSLEKREDCPETLDSSDGSEEWLISEHRVETPFFSVELNEKGQFTSIYDKKCGRQILQENKCGNVIVSYEDRPHNYDAWDINNYYTEKSWEVDQVSSIAVTEEGPLRGCIRIERPYLESVIVQYLYFYRDLGQIDIRNEIDWKEQQILLRDYFPVDVHTAEATYEIQYGNVKRSTHSNTSWDFARFEVCSHKWLDVSEDGYGVSILNDCKYGCSVRDSVIGLSMLKSGIYPNPDADKEHHTFWYSICPHAGDFREGATVAKAYALNNPYRAVTCSGTADKTAACSLVSSSADNVVIETVKQQEDGEDLIIRLYECYNRRTDVELSFGFAVAEASECNMLEREETPLALEDGKLILQVRPYEIRTLRVKLEK